MLRKLKVNYIKKYGLMILIFLSSTIIALIVFKELILESTKNFTLIPFIVLILVVVINICIYYFSHKYLKNQSK